MAARHPALFTEAVSSKPVGRGAFEAPPCQGSAVGDMVKTDGKDARGIAQLIRILRRAFANWSPTTQCCSR